MTVQYEWDCETVADGDSANFEGGEVIDHAHGTSYRAVLEWSKRYPAEAGFLHQIVLVRDDDEGRSWAYVEDGCLPQFFTDADGADCAVVPRRFVREVLAANVDPDPADDLDRSFGPLRAAAMRREDAMGAGFASARECAIDEQAALDRPEFDYNFDYVEGE